VSCVLVALAVALGSSACGTSAARPQQSAIAPPAATLLPTSFLTSTAAWATIPMGHLDQPLNTFWQLFVLPRGQNRWASASSIGIATNGGLVLTGSGGPSLVVGTRPSNLLSFSPVASTSNAGTSWSPGPPVAALASWTNALAAAAGGGLLALVGSGHGSGVLSTSPGAAGWTALTSERSLSKAGEPASCRMTTLTAVAYDGTTPVVGAACGRPGVVGLLADRSGAWRLAGPSLAASLQTGTVEVLAAEGWRAGLSVVLGITDHSRTTLVAAFTSDLGGSWSVSAPLALASGAKIVSIGPAGRGVFVLWSNGGSEQLETATAAGAGWKALPAPPPATATVAFLPAGRTEAIAEDDTVMTVWRLTRGGVWTKTQVMHVPIQFGSSS